MKWPLPSLTNSSGPVRVRRMRSWSPSLSTSAKSDCEVRSRTARPAASRHVREGAVAVVAEEPVGQALGLRDVDVVEAVAVEVADRHAVVSHAPRHEERRRGSTPTRRGRERAGRRKEAFAPSAASVASVKTGAGARLRSGRGPSTRSRARRRRRRGASASASGRPARCGPRRGPCPRGRSARSCGPRGPAGRVTSIAVMRNSAVCSGVEVADQGQRARGRTWRGPGPGSAGSVRARKTSSCGLLPREHLVGGRQPAALELRGQERRRLGRRGAGLAQERAQLAEAPASSSASFSSGNASVPAARYFCTDSSDGGTRRLGW